MSGSLLQRAKDDFVLHSSIDRSVADRKKPERRLHLRAFDYWHALHSDKPIPLFSDLTPDGLLPFKRNCLLIEFAGKESIVRFCGAEFAPLLGGLLQSGDRLSAAKIQGFSLALQDRLSTPESRKEAAEFEFVDDPLECRGILLPLSARGQDAEFMMIVVNHRHRSIGVQERGRITLEEPDHISATDQASEDSRDFAELTAACQKAAASVVHPGAGTRQGLYAALAQAYRFHIEASKNPTAYRRYLRTHKMRQQRRAPFTPALKLTFGADYEKTRLTEYAAALSYAARQEVGPDDLVDFLVNEPGGIKGCVARERALRRGDPLSPPADTAEIIEKARRLPSVDLAALEMTREFNLVLVRTDTDGNKAVLSVVDAADQLVDRAVKKALERDQEQ